MKNTFFALATIAAAMFGTANLKAESVDAVRFTINFDFVAGAKTFPAGTYIVQPGRGHNVVKIDGETNKLNAMILASGEEHRSASSKTMVLFHRYGSRTYLHEVSIAGEPIRTRLAPAAQEREAMTAKAPFNEVRVVASR